jgi:hypothetical protein
VTSGVAAQDQWPPDLCSGDGFVCGNVWGFGDSAVWASLEGWKTTITGRPGPACATAAVRNERFFPRRPALPGCACNRDWRRSAAVAHIGRLECGIGYVFAPVAIQRGAFMMVPWLVSGV